jgi:hypothetical protein
MLQRLLREDPQEWEALILDYQTRIKALTIPADHTTESLYHFNRELDRLYADVQFDFARAQRNKEAIDAFLDSVLKDYYGGKNEAQRRAGGIQMARAYPNPTDSSHSINLLDLADHFGWYYDALKSCVKVLDMKAGAKITWNSLLSIEQRLIPG